MIDFLVGFTKIEFILEIKCWNELDRCHLYEYESLGHMSLVPARQLRNGNAVYIPHHAANSEKFQVVFDGSCKIKDGPSPNDIQLNGERLQRELTYIYFSHICYLSFAPYIVWLHICIFNFLELHKASQIETNEHSN